MDTETLKTFLGVYLHGSFAAVAKEKNQSPSSVSRSIQNLEDELGVLLFQRTTRKVIPTEQGIEYFQRIEPLIEELEAANSEIQDSKGSTQGILRITAPVSFSQNFLTDWIPDFLDKNSEVKFELLATDTRVDLMKDRIDLAIRFGHLDDSSMISSKLCSLDYAVCTHPSYLEKTPAPNTPQDLLHHNCLSFLLPKFRTRWKFKKKEIVEEVSIHGNISTTNALSLREFALRGIGLVLLPKILVKKQIERNELIQVLSDYDVSGSEFGSSIWIVYPSKSYLPKRTRNFIEFLKQRVSEI